MKRIQLIAGLSAVMFLTAGSSVVGGSAHSGPQKPKAVKALHATHGAALMSAKPAKLAKATKPKPGVSLSATTTLTPVQAKLQKNANLAAKLKARLPAGTDLMTASGGFRNLGQFVAAVNVWNNLGIPFAQLKAKMVTDGLSLGQAIQALRPASSGTVEAQRAEYDARGMISESPQPITITVSTKARPKPKKVSRTQMGSQD